jgi:Tfp pilus assembly protein PilN
MSVRPGGVPHGVVGIAVGKDSLVAAHGQHTAMVEVGGGVAGAAPTALAEAFRDLRDRLRGAGRTRARLVLLPPLVDARLVELPPLRLQESEAVLRRDPRRYFLNDGGARVIGVAERPRGQAAPVMAAAAGVMLVDELAAAATAAGWRVDGVAAAHGAWLAAARSAGASHVVVALEDTLHVVGGGTGRVRALRRLPAAAIGQVAAAAPGRTLVLAADAEVRRALRAALADPAPEPDRPGPLEAAATHADHGQPRLVTAQRAATLRAAARTRAALLAVAAVLLVLGAAFVELWGVERELEAVRARRAALRAEVAPLLVLRDSLDALADRSRAIDALEADAPTWSPALLDLALLLPEDAHVTGLRTAGDTLVADAVANRAGAALQALRGSAVLRDVRLRGVVEREMSQGSTARERFTFTAHVAPAGTGRLP